MMGKEREEDTVKGERDRESMFRKKKKKIYIYIYIERERESEREREREWEFWCGSWDNKKRIKMIILRKYGINWWGCFCKVPV